MVTAKVIARRGNKIFLVKPMTANLFIDIFKKKVERVFKLFFLVILYYVQGVIVGLSWRTQQKLAQNCFQNQMD
jgi:hypothetical protein